MNSFHAAGRYVTKEKCVENKRASLLVLQGKALSWIPHFKVEDRWPATPK